MKRTLIYKTTFILIVILLCFYGIFGLPFRGRSLRQNMADRIKLGLDLKGGTHLILQVHVDEAVAAETAQNADRLKDLLKSHNINFDDVRAGDDKTSIHVRGIPSDKTGEFRDILNERFTAMWEYASGANNEYTLRLKQSARLALQEDALKQSLETIRRRVDELGLTEPDIREHGRGEYAILVQLPGVDDPARVKEIMQTTAMLEIKEVKDPQAYPSPEAALAAHGGVLPEGTMVLRSVDRAGTDDPNAQQWYIVTRAPVITGRDLRTARVGADENGRPEVDFTIRTDGAQRFSRYTESNVGNYMGVSLDNRLYTVARIESRIGDNGRIMGNFSQERARDLALVLKAGALPASISYLEERTVGASLGADSIRQGLLAGIVGLTAVILFMLFYYRRSGINAVLALFLNLVVLLAVLGYFGAVLTLPGIAGIILLIGMAVDSNVLIFERIREELRTGKSIPAAVKAGFDKAFLTIIDTHVTTVVACLFLFLFGTGSIRGFAVTLVAGLLANVFTAVFVSRTIFEWELYKSQKTTLSI